jgi:hypothetical protein
MVFWSVAAVESVSQLPSFWRHGFRRTVTAAKSMRPSRSLRPAVPKKIEGASAVKPLRPLSIEPRSFYAPRSNLA